MIFFNDKYDLELDINQKDFVDGLLKKTELREDVNNDLLPKKKKDFLGKIEYNSFSIVLNKSALFQNNFRINGLIIGQGAKTQIKGSIKGYKFLFLFVFAFSIFSLGGLIYYIFFIPRRGDLTFFLLILTVIGSINIFGVVNRLNKYKRQFIDKLKTIE